MDEAERNRIAAEYFASPHGQEYLKKQRESTVATIIEPQVKACRLGSLSVERNGANLHLKWRYSKTVFKSPRDCFLTLFVRDIDLYPSAETLHNERLEIPQHGDGEYVLECNEGDCMQLFMMFADVTEGKKPEEILMDGVYVRVAIPLSDESRNILDKAYSEGARGGMLKAELDAFLDKHDAFDASCREAIARIKAKGLPPDEEERRIADFEDFARTAKEKYGM